MQHSRENEMIRARSVVDVLQQASPASKELSRYRVECWGEKPHDFVRIYTISARSEDVAAREGLDRFVEEVSALISDEDE